MGPQTNPETALALLAKRVGPSLVRIGKGWGRGGGFVLSEGYIVTNAHNLADRTTTVTFQDGREEQGGVEGIDAEGDLVVLRVDTADAPGLAWDPDQEPLVLGQDVVCVALAAGDGMRATKGTVSATERNFRGPSGRPITHGVEHTAPLARGSSGVPLLDLEGKLVGINTHRVGDGFYLAVPTDRSCHERIDGLRRGESPQRRRLGIAIVPPPAARRLRAAVGLAERDGLLIHAVEPDSPAQRAGLRQGDLVLKVAGRVMRTPPDLYEVLNDLAQESIELVVLRGTEELALSVGLS